MARLIEITGKALSGEWGSDDEIGVGILVLRTTNFTNEGMVDYSDVVTRCITKKNIEEKYLKKGDIIIEKSGGSDKQPVGRVVYFDGPENRYLFNNFTGLLRVKDQDKWFPKYVFYSLFSNYKRGGTRPYENKTTGLHNLKIDDYVSRYEVADIGIDEQVKICNVLDMLQVVINKKEEQLEQLDLLVKARFVEMFGDVALNPKGWDRANFEDISILITDGEHATPRRTDEGIYLLSARNILNHALQLDDVDYIDEEEYERITKRVIPREGDVLISCSGSIGRCCVVPSSFRFHMVRSVALVRFDNTINPVFAEWLITSDELQRQILQSANKSSQANLFQGKIKKLSGIVPPLELQNNFAAFVSQVDKSRVAIKKALDEAQLLFDSLMQKYFG